MSVGGRRSNRRSQDVDTPALDRLVQTGRERLIPIMKQELAVAIAGKPFPQLLDCPLSGRMCGHVEVNETPGPDLKSNEYIKDAESCGHRNKEIAGHNLVRMIAEEGGPALVVAFVWS
jgi:hypothetical protein